MRNGKELKDLAETENQQTVAKVIEEKLVGTALNDAVLTSNSNENLATTYQALTGELHLSTSRLLLNATKYGANAVSNRLRIATSGIATSKQAVIGPLSYSQVKAARQADLFNTSLPPEELTTALWGDVYGSWTRFDGDGNAKGYKGKNAGIITGGDIGFDTIGNEGRLGFYGGYQSSTLNGSDTGAASVDTYTTGLYAGFDLEGFGIRIGTNYNWHEIDTERSAFVGAISERNTATYDAQTFGAFGEVGYKFNVSQTEIEPYAALRYANIKTDRFVESGGVTRLYGEASSNNHTVSTFGVRASQTSVITEELSITTRGTLGWNHGFGDLEPASMLAIANSGAFTMKGASLAKNAAVVEAGIDFNFTPNTRLGLTYQGEWASNIRDNSIRADLSIKF